MKKDFLEVLILSMGGNCFMTLDRNTMNRDGCYSAVFPCGFGCGSGKESGQCYRKRWISIGRSKSKRTMKGWNCGAKVRSLHGGITSLPFIM